MILNPSPVDLFSCISLFKYMYCKLPIPQFMFILVICSFLLLVCTKMVGMNAILALICISLMTYFYMLIRHLCCIFEIPVCVYYQFFCGVIYLFHILNILNVCWILTVFWLFVLQMSRPKLMASLFLLSSCHLMKKNLNFNMEIITILLLCFARLRNLPLPQGHKDTLIHCHKSFLVLSLMLIFFLQVWDRVSVLGFLFCMDHSLSQHHYRSISLFPVVSILSWIKLRKICS